MNRPSRPQAILFALLLTLAAQAAPAAAASSPTIGIASEADGDQLVLRVSATQASADVLLVLTHFDPLAGTIVDRVVPLSIPQDHEARVAMRDLRLGVPFTARVYDASTALPRLPHANAFFDGAALDGLPELARAAVPAIAREATDHFVRVGAAYVAPHPAPGPHVTSTRTGHVLVTTVEDDPARLVGRVSNDGGRTFGQPITLLHLGSVTARWTTAEAHDGRVDLVVWFPFEAVGPRLLRVDVQDPRLDVSSPLTFSTGMRPSGPDFSLARLPSGALIMAASGAYDVDEPGIDTQWRDYYEPSVWRISTAGEATLLGFGAGAPGAPSSLRLTASPNGMLGLAWSGIQSEWIAFSRSADSGSTWTAPQVTTREATGMTSLNGLLSAVASDDGSIVASLEGVTSNHVHALLIRQPASGAASTTSAVDLVPAGKEQWGSIPQLSARDGRIWAVWGGIHTWLAESIDGGKSWSTPLRPAWRIAHEDIQYHVSLASTRHSLAVLPDGRPLVLSSSPPLSAATFFDPTPRAADGLVHVDVTPLAAPPTRPLALAWDVARLVMQPGTPVEARLTVTNHGDAPLVGGSFYVSVPMTPYLTPTSIVDVPAGATRTWTFRFEPPADESARGGVIRIEVRQGETTLVATELDYFVVPLVLGLQSGSPVQVDGERTTEVVLDVWNAAHVGFLPAHLTYELPPGGFVTGAKYDEVHVHAGQSSRVAFEVFVPREHAETGELVVRAWHAGDLVSRPLRVPFALREPGSEPQPQAPPPTRPPALVEVEPETHLTLVHAGGGHVYLGAGIETPLRLVLRIDAGVPGDATHFEVVGAPAGVHAPIHDAPAHDGELTLRLMGSPHLELDPTASGTLQVIARIGARDASAPLDVAWSAAPVAFVDMRPSVIAVGADEAVVRFTLVHRGERAIEGARLVVEGLPTDVVVDTGAPLTLVPGQVAQAALAFTSGSDAPPGDSRAVEVTIMLREGDQLLAREEVTLLVRAGAAPTDEPLELTATESAKPGPRIAGFALFLTAGAFVGIVAFPLRRTDLLWWAASAVAAPLYTRLEKSDVLHHDVRAGVLAHVQQNPGIRYESLRRALSLPNGVLGFHLRVLEREGFVVGRQEWTRRLYYATGAAPASREHLKAGDQITRLLEEEPGLTASGVALRLGISRQLARYHLRALERDGRIDGDAQGYRALPR